MWNWDFGLVNWKNGNKFRRAAPRDRERRAGNRRRRGSLPRALFGAKAGPHQKAIRQDRRAGPGGAPRLRQTGERAQFVVEEQGRGIYLYIETGEHAVRTGLSVGQQIYLHSTSAGKVILSLLPDDRVNEILDEYGLPPLTENTITDSNELKSQLDEIRERGYAFNREENIKGLRAVSGPVTDENDILIGVLSVSGPSHRMKGEWFQSGLPDLVLGTANELELRIAYA
ncbi:MAG: hypothetical protein BRD45_03965 [Bacteroidetes bacterium QS_8_64_10]|nr:MAG: hypothetical protein BRD45_03965 [Bacteroidetes bacterium QS_8_64_10]